MSLSSERFITICDNLHLMNKKEREIARMNDDLFSIAMVYMKYMRVCVVEEMPGFFGELELFEYEFTDSRGREKYVVYTDERDIGALCYIVSGSNSAVLTGQASAGSSNSAEKSKL
jgi:hypothetical protein